MKRLILPLILLFILTTGYTIAGQTPLVAKKPTQTQCSFNWNNKPLELNVSDARTDKTALATTTDVNFTTTLKQYLVEYLGQCGLAAASTSSGAAGELKVELQDLKDNKNPGIFVAEVQTEAVAKITLLKDGEETFSKTMRVERGLKRMFVTQKKKNPKWVNDLLSELAFNIARDGDMNIAISKLP